MKRRCAFALVGLLVVPALAGAQNGPTLPPTRFSITPFVGARIGYTATNELTTMAENGSMFTRFEEARGGGVATGAEIEFQVSGPVSLVGSLVYSQPGEIVVTEQNTRGQIRQYEQVVPPPPTVWFAKAGVSVRLPEPPAPDNRRYRPVAFLTAGPALVRENYEESVSIPASLTEPVNNWALNLGAKAVAPLWSPRVAFVLGLEDYFTFWNTGEWERRLGDFLEGSTDYDAKRSHILMWRTGLSFRF